LSTKEVPTCHHEATFINPYTLCIVIEQENAIAIYVRLYALDDKVAGVIAARLQYCREWCRDEYC